MAPSRLSTSPVVLHLSFIFVIAILPTVFIPIFLLIYDIGYLLLEPRRVPG
ncbi:hypothetical protein K504DRAFT_499682 [Pleomassaria siparia CBS 279.74]|uniref:Uncharacterized protein n=1 Tax=Pleomassaria siparia CBS 279.74 TaxID=1314801 RepID=A0A6G1KID8_9PLEO|nr:hypothetical protein K504DRAFT_499682 [Pleomassaria siparia CBS 279.74]